MSFHLKEKIISVLEEENTRRRKTGERDLRYTHLKNQLSDIERHMEKGKEKETIDMIINMAKKDSMDTFHYLYNIRKDIYRELNVSF